jgi:uncharacterized protein
MPIIDSHCHLGSCTVFDLDVSEEALLKAMDANRIDAAIVQPFPGAPHPAEVHDRIAELAAKHPGRFFGLASVNPHSDEQSYRAEVRRCVRQLGFVGVKLHTIGHSVGPFSRAARLVFTTARELGVAVDIHTGPGVPFGLPSLFMPLAKEFADVPLVLAHSGWGIFTGEAFVVARECPNVYLETSWCGIDDTSWLLGEFGADRLMMGSDSLANMAVELAKHRALGLSDEMLSSVLGGTATSVYQLGATGRNGGGTGEPCRR